VLCLRRSRAACTGQNSSASAPWCGRAIRSPGLLPGRPQSGVAAQEARAHADHQHNEADTVGDGDDVAVRGDVNERVPIPMAHCAVGEGIDVQSGLDQREHQDVLTDSWPWPKEEPTEDRHDRHDIVQERIGDGGRSCNSYCGRLIAGIFWCLVSRVILPSRGR
jgi:hypothetical protein